MFRSEFQIVMGGFAEPRYVAVAILIVFVNVAFTGSRFGRGAIVPGGVREDGRVDLDGLLRVLDVFEAGLRHDRRLFLGTSSQTDRLIGSGRLPRALVEAHDGVGPVARGSGIATDARHERPYTPRGGSRWPRPPWPAERSRAT